MKKIVLILALAISSFAICSEGIRVNSQSEPARISDDGEYYIEEDGTSIIIITLIVSGNISKVQKALALGLDVNTSIYGRTFIEIAIDNNQLGMAKVLFDAGAEKPTKYSKMISKYEKTTPEQRFNMVLDWYAQRDLMETTSGRSNGQEGNGGLGYEQNNNHSWQTRINTHLPKIGLTIGTIAIVFVGKYLYQQYAAKNKTQNNKVMPRDEA